MESFIHIVLIGTVIINILGSIFSICIIGKHREPLKPGAVAISVMLNAVITYALLMVLTR